MSQSPSGNINALGTQKLHRRGKFGMRTVVGNPHKKEDGKVCGRFTQSYSWSEVHDFLRFLGTPRNLQPRYNIAPTTMIDVVRVGRAGRELVPMRWGLVPGWWKKSLKEVPATFNARSESVADKPMFRNSFTQRRCIIPASGFYEWTGPKTERQPHLFTAAEGSPILAFAGLWDRWVDPATSEEMLSCTMIVCGANEWMNKYHDRMPVMLDPEDFDSWLDGSLGFKALECAPKRTLREWLVSPRINRAGVGDDDRTMIAAIDQSPPAST